MLKMHYQRICNLLLKVKGLFGYLCAHHYCLQLCLANEIVLLAFLTIPLAGKVAEEILCLYHKGIDKKAKQQFICLHHYIFGVTEGLWVEKLLPIASASPSKVYSKASQSTLSNNS